MSLTPLKIKSVKDADVAGKRVLVRVDFNVPIKDGVVQSDLRIRAALPTLELLQKGAAHILLAHLGHRTANPPSRSSLLLWKPGFGNLRKCRSKCAKICADPREEAADLSFAKELAALGDVFINEAFADSHRCSSITGVPKFLPGYMGLRFEEEVRGLSAALTPPQGSIAIIGGAKFETKGPLIKKLLEIYAEVLLGGALANDVIKARGLPFGLNSVGGAVPVEVASNELGGSDRRYFCRSGPFRRALGQRRRYPRQREHH